MPNHKRQREGFCDLMPQQNGKLSNRMAETCFLYSSRVKLCANIKRTGLNTQRFIALIIERGNLVKKWGQSVTTLLPPILVLGFSREQLNPETVGFLTE